MRNVEIRKARVNDLQVIKQFTDYWLAGRGLKDNAPGAVNDYFITPKQHTKYITKYKTELIFFKKKLIGWGVIQNDGSLIHLLIHGEYRDKGYGSIFLNHLNPKRIHSKNDQSSGNPFGFYIKNGYEKTNTVKSKSRIDIDKIKPNRKMNIDIYRKLVTA